MTDKGTEENATSSLSLSKVTCPNDGEVSKVAISPSEPSINSDELRVEVEENCTANSEETKAQCEPEPDSGESTAVEPYAYTKRPNQFTSEIFKIEIANLPKVFGYKQFKKLLESKLNFTPVKIKAIPRAGFAFVTFRNEDERQKALKTFHKYRWKGKELITKYAKALPDPVASKRAKDEGKNNNTDRKLEGNDGTKSEAKKRLNDEDADHDDAKRPKCEEEWTPERLNDFVTPLWKKPYSEQIEIKHQTIVKTLQRLTDSLNEMMYDRNSRLDADESAEKKTNVTCELLPCLPSPVLKGYRNKCEFTIAKGPDKEKTVGFRVGNYRDGFSGVSEPSQCIHISDKAKTVANAFQKFVRQSTLDTFDMSLCIGYWQTLTVRDTHHNESMAIIQLNPQSLNEAEQNTLFQDIREFFESGEGKECQLSSLYVHTVYSRTSDIQAKELSKPKLLSGIPCIHESLYGVKFRISPDAFFQVNTQAAELMFDVIKQWMGDCSKSTLLDICCGAGTIGMSLAKHVSKVIGIELVESAVEDAKKNAEMNEIKNAEFIAGKAEDVLVEYVLKKLPFYAPVVGIADPPRAGLHRSVIRGIRGCTRMQRLIYVACNANNAFTNLVDLCRPKSKRIKTTPFNLVKAVPIDFFPHTQHCELVMLFEREGVMKDDSRQFHLSVLNEKQ